MSVADLLERARSAGVSIEPAGETLRLRAPAKPPDELLEELRHRKAELLAAAIAVERDPLPPIGDPRRPALELLDDAWAAGCRVVIAGGAAHMEPREAGGPVPGALRARLRALERDVVALLARVPAVGDALGGLAPEQGSLLAEDDLARMPLEAFARSRLVVEMRSEVLGETVVLAGDHAHVDPERYRGRALYRGAELLELCHC